MKNGLFILLILFCACSSLKVDYDYDAQTDFSSFKTYNYYPEMQTGLSELDTRRLILALDSVLVSKGFRSSEEPDFFINIESREFVLPQNSNVGVGIGGGGRNVGGGVTIGVPLGRSAKEREILFDFIDSQRDILFWQAICSSSYRENATPIERERMLTQTAIKVLSKYPPK